MRTVQQNVFLILNSVPVTSVTDPELIRPSIPVMTHSFFVIPPAKSNPQRFTKMCVISLHNYAGMVIIMWCQIVKLSPAPNDTFAQSELKLFYIDSFSRSYGIQKLLRCREILECVQNLISPCIASICNNKVSLQNFLKKRIFKESKLFQNRMMHLNQ